MTMAETQEYTTLKQVVPQLRLAVQSNLVTLSGHLFAKGLITDEEEIELRNDSKSRAYRAADLISMVMNKVKLDPQYFKIFIDILKSSGVSDIDITQLELEPQSKPSCEKMPPAAEISEHIPLSSTGKQIVSTNQLQHTLVVECECHICTSVLKCPLTVINFPLLNLDERGKEDFIFRLKRDTKNIMMQFHGVESGLYNTICDKVPIERLKFHLLHAVKASQSEQFEGSIFKDYENQLQTATNTHTILSVIRKFWSFLDYDLLEHMIEFLGNEDDKKRMVKYRENFDQYAKRRIIECPNIKPVDDDNWENVYIKLDLKLETFTINELREFRFKISEIIGVSVSAIHFCCVKRGCIQVMLQIPCFMKKIIFPLVPEKENTLKQLGVTQFSCLDYVYSAPMQVSNLKSPFKSDAIGSMTVTPNSDPEGYKHKPAYHGSRFEKQKKIEENVDCRGVPRGRCSMCACDGYSGGSEKKKCTGCGHLSGKHQKLGTTLVGNTGQSSVSASSSGVFSISAPFSPPRPATSFDVGTSHSDSAFFISRSPAPVYQCRYPNCQMETDFDPNTGVQKAYCQQHTLYTQFQQQSAQASYDPFTTPQSHWSVGNTDSSDFASSQSDSSDDEQDQSSSKHVHGDATRIWRTQPPPVTTPPVARPMTAPPPPQVQQPASLNLSGQQVCKLPGCNRPRYVEQGGKVHDFCGRTHAQKYQQQYGSTFPGGQYDPSVASTAAMFNVLNPFPQPGTTKCAILECPNPCHVDEDGTIHQCCSRSHAREFEARSTQQTPAVVQTGAPMPTPTVAVLPAPQFSSGAVLPPSQKCAIVECPNPRYVDESGTVHECCGITHAMEHQRRLALMQQTNQQVIKGVTHCYLPECNRPTWPFMNYCGRTHAQQGQQRNLPPPPPLTSGPAAGIGAAATAQKTSSMCPIPGCTKPKFVDPNSGVTHDFCGKTHAEEGKRRGIRPQADKPEDQCDLPGCINKKRTEGTTVYDYCCRDHATQDIPNRAARVLTSHSEVQKFLKQFSNLTVVSLDENSHAKPGGQLFNRFRSAFDKLPKDQRKTCLAFHGTAEKNIQNICTNGYDPKLRCGQAYGAGEYFATKPNIPLSYCKGGKKMLLNELLLGKAGTHHTQHGDIVVMKNSDHDLPRYVITFK